MVISEGTTNQVAQILTAIAQLLWPIAALVLALKLLPELKSIFQRISESQNLKVKWGDKELSIQEAADNIQKVVGSLVDTEAAKGSVYRGGIDSGRSGEATGEIGALEINTLPGESAKTRPSKLLPRRILWVDDKPKDNAFEIAKLKEQGIPVDEALSTEQAVDTFEAAKYGLLVTNMSRRQGDEPNPEAGIDLLRKILSVDPEALIIAYTNKRRVQQKGPAFLQAGGLAVTSSTTELFELVNRYLPS